MFKSRKPAGDISVRVNLPAPDFSLRSNKNLEWCLSEQRGNTVVLLFYPGNETFLCTRQLCSVRDNWADYLKTKATIVGISPGTVEEHQSFSNNHNLPMELLADDNRKITGMYCRHRLFPLSLIRAVVVIDAKGIVRARDIMLRAFRPTDEQIIRTIRSVQAERMFHTV